MIPAANVCACGVCVYACIYIYMQERELLYILQVCHVVSACCATWNSVQLAL